MFHLISSCLSVISKLALLDCTLTGKMQKRKVLVTYNGGDEDDLGNYRPTSFSPLFFKRLGEVIHE